MADARRQRWVTAAVVTVCGAVISVPARGPPPLETGRAMLARPLLPATPTRAVTPPPSRVHTPRGLR